MQQPFLAYKDKVKYDYILQSTSKVECELSDVENIIKLFSDEDFLGMYFPNVGLGCVYTQTEYLNGKLRILFGVTTVDYKQPFDEDYLEQCIKEVVTSLNKNVDNINIEKGEIKVDLISKPADLENIDKKLVSENTIRFCNGDDVNCFSLTDDGIVEIYHNSILEHNFPFSKVGLIRECKNLLENDYTLVEDTFNPDMDTNTIKKELEQNIDAVEELQDLKDELDDKVSTLMGESLETTDEYALVVFKKSGNKFNPSAAIQNISIDGYYTADKMGDVGIYHKDEADRYAEIFNRYKKKDNIELQAITKDELQSLNLVKESVELDLYDEFPSSEISSAPINLDTLQQMDLNNDLTQEQQVWLIIHMGSISDFYSAMVDLFNECQNDIDVQISIDDYISNLLDGGVIETWKTKI